jgi:hypothetical protein
MELYCQKNECFKNALIQSLSNVLFQAAKYVFPLSLRRKENSSLPSCISFGAGLLASVNRGWLTC